ncbi:MAG: M48 family metalloprotease, partial [Verrucomicrobia bacterium]|nr:M48 family metalloprotease [Verrucomicrobiota bacterium]
MDTLETFFPWLLRTSWQASVLVGLVLLVQGLFRRKLSAGWRYSLWLLVVLRLMLPATPESALSIFNLAQFHSAAARDSSLQPFHDLTTTPPLVPPNASERISSEPSTSTTPPHANPNIASLPPTGPRRSTLSTLLAWSPTLWLAGVILLLLRILCQNARFVARIRRRRPVTDSAVLDLLEDCKSLMGVRTPLSVVETSAVKSPALCGFVRPRLLLPENLLASFSPRELRYVLLHELAHVKRLDMAMNWVVTALRVLHWFNPVIWFAFRRLAA